MQLALKLSGFARDRRFVVESAAIERRFAGDSHGYVSTYVFMGNSRAYIKASALARVHAS